MRVQCLSDLPETRSCRFIRIVRWWKNCRKTIDLSRKTHTYNSKINFVESLLLQVFTTIFTVECLFKLIALGNGFFNCGWNIFDMIIVTASLLDLSFEMIDGLSVLRCLRLVREHSVKLKLRITTTQIASFARAQFFGKSKLKISGSLLRKEITCVIFSKLWWLLSS